MNMNISDLECTDKSTWGEGPWQSEPDRVEFEHAGLPCLLQRAMHSGHWCGYVAVPPGHPLHGKDWQKDKRIEALDAHMGVNYSHQCCEPICHVPKPGEPEDVWWLGFDCGHARDLCPARNARLDAIYRLQGREPVNHMREEWETYRDVAYVRAVTEKLAEQLQTMK